MSWKALLLMVINHHSLDDAPHGIVAKQQLRAIGECLLITT